MPDFLHSHGTGSAAALKPRFPTPIPHPENKASTSMNILGLVVVFSIAYAYVDEVIHGPRPIITTHIILILAVFCAVFIAGNVLWPLLWTGLEIITSVIGWLTEFIIFVYFIIGCLLVFLVIGTLALFFISLLSYILMIIAILVVSA
ncbi:uncharacterized protein EV420DRAFT_1545633 [Desarmillaria tabescens]|uniref:Transmembrane protein n=1 Tax=Armillaria tabescens TaxID=1929756 RepID=A0AA39N5G6_ARMTA|nr:uncharacterized protein EV420DRAFT_1545633 [Desarmillaria tabescens]KAK0457970.1 hypothetical protein EV420DRAFT_1545633 [Desarmillaria tabescens]